MKWSLICADDYVRLTFWCVSFTTKDTKEHEGRPANRELLELCALGTYEFRRLRNSGASLTSLLTPQDNEKFFCRF